MKCDKKIKIVHIEAGLRSFDNSMIEETNRKMIDSVADILFVTEESAVNNLLKENSILINLSRGGVVNENALYHALKNNKILGAASDVFEHEPYSGKLCNLENIILTPHIGSYAKEGKLQMEIDAVNNLIKKLNKWKN